MDYTNGFYGYLGSGAGVGMLQYSLRLIDNDINIMKRTVRNKRKDKT